MAFSASAPEPVRRRHRTITVLRMNVRIKYGGVMNRTGQWLIQLIILRKLAMEDVANECGIDYKHIKTSVQKKSRGFHHDFFVFQIIYKVVLPAALALAHRALAAAEIFALAVADILRLGFSTP
jgi:hypothetical protein